MNRRTNKSRKEREKERKREREKEFGFPEILRTSLPGSTFSENKSPVPKYERKR